MEMAKIKSVGVIDTRRMSDVVTEALIGAGLIERVSLFQSEPPETTYACFIVPVPAGFAFSTPLVEAPYLYVAEPVPPVTMGLHVHAHLSEPDAIDPPAARSD